uniref:Scaffolding protein n=2 Tax=unclassified Mycobacterium TaxID=2642494 RepID=A1UJR5_MYCSK
MPESSTTATDSGSSTGAEGGAQHQDSTGRELPADSPEATERQDNPASEAPGTDTGGGAGEPVADSRQVSDDPPADLQEGEPDPADDGKPDREAAKYRRERNEARAEVDRLRATVETFQRAEVERLAALKLIDGRDVWAAGAKLADLLADDGTVDIEKVSAAAQEIAATRRHWAKQAAAPASVVTGNQKPGYGDDEKTTWGDVFQRVRNGVAPEDR